MGDTARWLGLLRSAEEQAIPLHVSCELTRRCTFDCVHCYLPGHDVEDLVSTEQWLRLINELTEMGTLCLSFTGGEPLLHPDWQVLVRRARALGFDVTLLTNGELVDQGAADLLTELMVLVEVSVYSSDPAVFDAVTRRPGSFSRTLAGVKLLRSSGAAVRFKVPIMTCNLEDLESTQELARSVGAQCQQFYRISHRTDGTFGPLDLRVSSAGLRSLLGTTIRCQDPRLASPPAALCAAGRRMAVVGYDGAVRACSLLSTTAGNIRETSFREIWERSPWLTYVRSLTRSDLRTCNSCDSFAYCKRCLAQALAEDGDLLGPARWSCEHARVLEDMVRLRPTPRSGEGIVSASECDQT